MPVSFVAVKLISTKQPGDNFASSLFRVTISFKSKFTKGETKTLSLIVKVQMTTGLEGAHMDFLKDSPLFRNEMEMYGKILPDIQSLWLSVGDKDLLFPK